MLPGRSCCLPHSLCCVTSLPDLKEQILSLTRDYARRAHAAYRPAADPIRTPWPEGSPIPYAGRVFTEDEVEAAVAARQVGPGVVSPEAQATADAARE